MIDTDKMNAYVRAAKELNDGTTAAQPIRWGLLTARLHDHAAKIMRDQIKEEIHTAHAVQGGA